MNAGVEIRQATRADLDSLVPLFDTYRRFYRQPSEPERVKRFLCNRFEQNDSVIFLAFERTVAIGFAQLYPSLSSVSMGRIFILNDLFVVPEARGRGAGTALLQAAANYGRQAGAVRLVLSTETGNAQAQSVYEKFGWKRDTAFYVYQLKLER